MPTISSPLNSPPRPLSAAAPANLKNSQPTSQAPGGDQVHFGGTNATTPTTPVEDTNDVGDKPQKPTLATAAKNGLKGAFNLKGLAYDVGIGALLAVATAIIPPHAHALAMIPFSLIIGTSIRAFSAIKQTYWPSK